MNPRSILVVCCLMLTAVSNAWAGKTYSLLSFAPASDGISKHSEAKLSQPVRVALAENLFDVLEGDTLVWTPGELIEESYEFTISKRMEHLNGDVSILARIGKTDSSLSLTLNANGMVFGVIKIPTGRYLLKTDSAGIWLIPPEVRNQLQPIPKDNGGVVPPRPISSGQSSSETSIKPMLSAVPAEQSLSTTTVIDVMVFWDSALQSRLGSEAAVRTLINNKVAYTNQAFLDSEIAIQIRLVYSAMKSYSNRSSNEQALDDIQSGASVFADVAVLRSQYGADLVGFVRDFQYPEHQSAGIAYRLGSEGQMDYTDKQYAFFVVSDGEDGSYFAPENTFAHELGHNLGSEHDHSHSGSEVPIFPYSFGHDDPGVFATIMSYDEPEGDVFSNPNITCAGQPCGVASGYYAADNARGFNEIREQVATFYPQMVDSSPSIQDLDSDGIEDELDLMPQDATNNPDSQDFRVLLSSLFQWAEINYPTLFYSPHSLISSYDSWRFVYYPATGNYIGFNVDDQEIYVLGTSWGGRLVKIDSMLNLLGSAGLR